MNVSKNSAGRRTFKSKGRGGAGLIRTISSRLRVLRGRHGLTRKEAAGLAGMGPRHYQSIEAGSRKQIGLTTLVKLARTFGLEPWQLIGPKLPGKPRHAKITKCPQVAGL